MLTIDEVARRLNGERHGDAWMCSCPLPGHRDGDAKRSLSVSMGRNGGILMHCFVHDAARIEEFASAMGLSVSDFMPDDARPASKKAPKPWREFRVGDRDKNGYEITAVYVYENADGSVGMRKCRKQRPNPDGTYEKTFLMQAPKDGKWWRPGDIGSDAVHLLYHLPEVLGAIREGRTVIIAEGEKDVDNLRALGYVATCSATGGGTGRLEGKFTEAQAAALDGADVVLIPDNDEAGEGYVRWIADMLWARGTRCRVIRLTDDMPDLPPKGDFTDWAQILKSGGIGRRELMDRLQRLIDAAPDYTGGDGLTLYTAKPAAPASARGGDGQGGGEDEYPSYHGSTKFCLVGKCLAKRVQNGARVLAYFTPEPREIIRLDDGLTVRQRYKVGGVSQSGRALPDVIIDDTRDFLGPTWSIDAWNYDGAMASSRGAPAEILEAILFAGRQDPKIRTIYAHAGMRVIDGAPCYLYHGGAIGRDGVSVELGGPLVRSDLSQQTDDDGNAITRERAAQAERTLLGALPLRVIGPMLAQAYLAPVYSILEEMQVPPAHVVLLDGKTNAGKSTTAGYVASHFGNYYGKAMPASFADSQAGMRDKLFIAKDSLLIVDDYRRQAGEGGKRSTQDMLADMVISAIADHAGRSRENADRTMERERPARCTCIMTGEVMPNISVSRRTRIYRITVDFGELLTPPDLYDELQEYQRQGFFRQCMREYIADLLARYDDLRGELRRRMREATARSRELVDRAEGRYREMAAHILLGADLCFEHLQKCGALSDIEREALLHDLGKQISLSLQRQGSEKDDALPEQRWLEAVRALYASSSLRLYDKRAPDSGQPQVDLDGFLNGDVVELIAGRIEAQVGELLRKGQRSLETADYQDIYRALAKRGMIQYKTAPDGSVGQCKLNTKFKGRQMQCIKLHRWALMGDAPEETQRQDGLTETDGPTPFD